MLQNHQCWFLKADRRPEIVVRRTAAIGDVLCATCVASKLIENGYEVRWQCHPDLHTMVRRVPTVYSVEEPKSAPHVNLDNAYESHPYRKKVSFADIFVAAADDQLTHRGVLVGSPTNCAPVLCVDEEEREQVRVRFKEYPRPWIVFAARSNSWANRTIPDGTLSQVAKATHGTCFWLANHAPAPEGFVDLNVRDIDTLIKVISVADLFVGPDSGPMHIAAALKIPVIALEQASSPELHLSDQRDFLTVKIPNLACANCQRNICPIPGRQSNPPCTEIDPALLAKAIHDRLTLQLKSESVSCVITTFKSPADRINKCIAAVIDQVDEVVVSKDAGGIFPHGLMTHAKLRYVSSPRSGLGYGKNANFGVRHTSGNFVLLLNDDCYLAPKAVSFLMDVARRDPTIGLVGHLLYYPDGRICHGGKIRSRGHRGWALMDNRQRVPTIREPRRLENVTGTSVLVRRSAFYDINGFDEDFFLYCEDDSMNLALQQAGHQLWYTPFATGIHDEAITNCNNFNMSQLLADTNKVFEKKWGTWLTENLNRIPKF